MSSSRAPLSPLVPRLKPSCLPRRAPIISTTSSGRRSSAEAGWCATASPNSTRVYQGALGKVDPRIVRGLERVTVGDAIPDLTIILDLAAELGLQRARSRGAGGDGDRFEQEGLDFHQQLRAAYREIAAREPGRCILIDAGASEDKVADEVWNAVRRRLGSAPAAIAAGAAAP